MLQSRCDEVNKECRELRESIQSKQIEVEKYAADIQELKERNRTLEADLQVLSNKQKRKILDNDCIENKRKSKEIKVDDEKIDEIEIVNDVIQIKKKE